MTQYLILGTIVLAALAWRFRSQISASYEKNDKLSPKCEKCPDCPAKRNGSSEQLFREALLAAQREAQHGTSDDEAKRLAQEAKARFSGPFVGPKQGS